MARAPLLLLAVVLVCCGATEPPPATSGPLAVELFVHRQVPDFYEIPFARLHVRVANLCRDPKLTLNGRRIAYSVNLGDAFEVLPETVELALHGSEVPDCVFTRRTPLDIDCSGQEPPIEGTRYAVSRATLQLQWGREERLSTTFHPAAGEVSAFTAFTVVVDASYDDLPRAVPFEADVPTTTAKANTPDGKLALQLFPKEPLAPGSTHTIRLAGGEDGLRTQDGHCLDFAGTKELSFRVRDEDPPTFRLEARVSDGLVVIDGDDLGIRDYLLDEGSQSVGGEAFDFHRIDGGSRAHFTVQTGTSANSVRCFRLRTWDGGTGEYVSRAACVDESR